MKIEYESAVDLADTRDFTEGIQAFLVKRKPDWD
jgi:enoyl-CoA hydratase/carnithine racemase